MPTPTRKNKKLDKRFKNPSRRSGYNAGIKQGLETGRKQGYAQGYARAKVEYDNQLLAEIKEAERNAQADAEGKYRQLITEQDRQYETKINDLQEQINSLQDEKNTVTANVLISAVSLQQGYDEFVRLIDGFIETKQFEIVHSKGFMKTDTMKASVDVFNTYGWRKLKAKGLQAIWHDGSEAAQIESNKASS